MRLGLDADRGAIDLNWGEDDPIRSAILISLFSDRRVEREETEDSRDLGGYWGDGMAGQERIGSKLWLLAREKPTDETRLRAEQYAAEALSWIAGDGFASEVAVSAHYDEARRLILKVEVESGRRVTYEIAVEVGNAI